MCETVQEQVELPVEKPDDVDDFIFESEQNWRASDR